MTNTNWQAYSGENTMSYLTQMLGPGGAEFLLGRDGNRRAARPRSRTDSRKANDHRKFLGRSRPEHGLCPSAAVVRPGARPRFARRGADFFRLPDRDHAGRRVGRSCRSGPAASQIAIKQLGTNGGGFFGANSAHPFENPTPLSNFLELLAIILIPAAIVYTYGVLVGNRRQGYSIYAAMMAVVLAGLAVALWAEYQSNPAQGGLNLLEGKEQRFGVMNSVLWADLTTVTSNGSVNAMHDSLSPLAGGVALFNLLLGECVFGGIGTGLYTMLLFVIITVFLAGLMVGRTPGISRQEDRSLRGADGDDRRHCPERLRADLLRHRLRDRSGPLRDGQCGSTWTERGALCLRLHVQQQRQCLRWPERNESDLSLARFAGHDRSAVSPSSSRCWPSRAASRRRKPRRLPPEPFRRTARFSPFLLIAVVLIVGVLTFFPVLSLGPIVEHFLVQSGRTF